MGKCIVNNGVAKGIPELGIRDVAVINTQQLEEQVGHHCMQLVVECNVDSNVCILSTTIPL